eukprot:241636_1
METQTKHDKADKGFHVFIVILATIIPMVWLTTYLCVSYANGMGVSYAISRGIAPQETYALVVTVTLICSLSQLLVTLCRLIQIRVIFEEKYDKYSQWKVLRLIAYVFTFIGHIGLILMAIFDTLRYRIVHGVFALSGIISLFVFGVLLSVLTVKQRYMDYQTYLIQSKQNKQDALRKTFLVDAVGQIALITIGAVFCFVYIIEFLMLVFSGELGFDKESNDAVGVPAYANMSEWIAFICMLLIFALIGVTFYHDSPDDELRHYFKCMKTTQYQTIKQTDQR